MLTRRTMLLGTIAAGAVMNSREGFGKAAQPSTAVTFDVPAHSCDCHTHIHADPEKFPLFAGRTYTPETASTKEMADLHRALGIERVVIVTPSIYGTDNSATLLGIRARGANARGVAVIDDMTPESDLDSMHQDGFRGIRVNLTHGALGDPTAAKQLLRTALDRMKLRGWHVQIYTSLPFVLAIKELVLTSPVPIVFDHFGGAKAALGLEQPGFYELVELLKSGKAYVKVSGAYYASTLAPDYQDLVPLAKALIGANPDRIVWGSDWPHPNAVTPPGKKVTDVTSLRTIDDGVLLNQLAIWAPDAAMRKAILIDNPARLYGFG